MKKIKNLLTVIMCALLIISPVMTETVSAATVAKTKGTSVSKVSNGWVTTSDGKTKYRKNGKFVKGCQKIGKSYYFFDVNGVMQRKDTTFRGVLYYINGKGQVQGRKHGSQYFSAAGKRLGKDKANDMRAYQNARRIVNGITNDHMSKPQKLRVCFNWMRNNGLGAWRKLSDGGNSWCAINANDLFERRRGDCISYACAFAYMAKVIGYKNVSVCSRATRKDDLHTWTEINGRVYDSYFGKRRGANIYYGVPYSKYQYRVVFRQKIA